MGPAFIETSPFSMTDALNIEISATLGYEKDAVILSAIIRRRSYPKSYGSFVNRYLQVRE